MQNATQRPAAAGAAAVRPEAASAVPAGGPNANAAQPPPPPNNEPDLSRQTRRPNNDAFKQQRLKAWQPMLTAKTVLPYFAVVGIVFIPVGIGLLIAAQNVHEIVIDYTDCMNVDSPNTNCSSASPSSTTRCYCELLFNVGQNGMGGDINIYYALDNYYQNHRRYVKSRDDYQLLGNLDSTSVSSDCDPFSKVNEVPIAPCGAIANSMFNDTFQFSYLPKGGSGAGQPVPVPLLKTGIAWWSDRRIKFRNPKNLADFNKFARPPYWQKNVTQLDEDNPDNNGFQNEDFIVWMRTAAFPNFRKLHRRLNRATNGSTSTNGQFNDGLPAGDYSVRIEYNYPVTSFGGRKKIILSTASWLGGKNPFLGWAYITVGAICIILAVVFLFIHKKWGRKLNLNTGDDGTNNGAAW